MSEQDPTISDLGTSRFFKKEDVDPPVILRTKSFRKENVALDEEEPRNRYVMYFDGSEKGLVLGTEVGECMEKITGSKFLKDWVGYEVELFVNPDIKFGGKKVGGIRPRTPTKGGFNEDEPRF